MPRTLMGLPGIEAAMNRSQTFLLFLLGVFSLLVVFVVLPFLEYVIVAVLLAYVLFPAHQRLEARIGSIPSAVGLITVSLIVLIVPILYVIAVFVTDLRALARGESDLEVATIEAQIVDVTGLDVDVRELLTTTAEGLFEVLFGGVGGVITGAMKAGIGIALMVFLLYYLLLEGDAFVAWCRDLVPFPDPVTDELVAKIDATTWGVIIGHISVAIVQALLAGFGLWATGVPDPVFWTFIMAVLALLPLIGAFLVWGPAAVYLVAIGQTTAGVLLAAYGLTVVSLFDNYARPLIIDRQAHLNPGILLVGVVGGIYAIGFTGVFIGPIIIAVLAATLETYRTEFDSL